MWHKFLLFLTKCFLQCQSAAATSSPWENFDPQQVVRVLLISMTGLGDTLFSTPALRAVKTTYPTWQIDFLCHQRWPALLSHNPYINQIFVYPGRNWRLISLAQALRRKNYDLVIILHGNDPEATLLAFLTKAPYIIGSGKSPLAFVYAAKIAISDPYEHAIERRLNYVRCCGADTPEKQMDIFLPRDCLDKADAILAKNFGRTPKLLIALHPTGSGAYKWWPQEYYIRLGTQLYQEHQADLLIISGKSDRVVAEAIAQQIPGPSLVTGGRFSLLAVAGLLSKCRLFVGNDSGPLHMALALGIPSLALIGADHPSRIGPYEVEWGKFLYRKPEVCSFEPCLTKRCSCHRCMQAISVEEVLHLLKRWWEPRFLSSGAADQQFQASRQVLDL